MNCYKEYISKLSWHKPEEYQTEAIDFLSKAPDWDFSNCIRKTSKDIWENLVKVIKNRSYNDKVKLSEELLFLLLDLNWPGALQGLEILKTLHREDIRVPLENALKSAYQKNDGNWIAYLYELIVYFKFVDSDFKEINLCKVISIKDW